MRNRVAVVLAMAACNDARFESIDTRIGSLDQKVADLTVQIEALEAVEVPTLEAGLVDAAEARAAISEDVASLATTVAANQTTLAATNDDLEAALEALVDQDLRLGDLESLPAGLETLEARVTSLELTAGNPTWSLAAAPDAHLTSEGWAPVPSSTLLLQLERAAPLLVLAQGTLADGDGELRIFAQDSAATWTVSSTSAPLSAVAAEPLTLFHLFEPPQSGSYAVRIEHRGSHQVEKVTLLAVQLVGAD